MPQKQCPFCQLIANPGQLKVVGETENFYAWLDINPRAKGYTMIVPKEHKDSIESFSPSEYQEAMNLTRKVVDKAKKGLGADGVSVTMNMGEAAGQMVPHAYIQVFPRFQDEESSGTPTGAIFQPHEEAKKNLDEIKDKMASVDSGFGETTKEPHPDSKKFKEEEKASEEKDTSRNSGDDKEAIDKIAEQIEGDSPLSLGGLTDSSDSGSSDSSDEKSSGKSVEASEEEDEVRIEDGFEGRSFEWQ
ncbi:HIT family protein [Candidatus Nanosalina sp. VS9-1]|uniref:HIT family protein n=1 Tax=Candidatus Nanosalina sp. VS9-1 TaxID=3388566 RepID=UPI0039DF7ABF